MSSLSLLQLANRLSSGFLILALLGSFEFLVFPNPTHIFCFIVAGLFMSISGSLYIFAEKVRAKEQSIEKERFEASLLSKQI